MKQINYSLEHKKYLKKIHLYNSFIQTSRILILILFLGFWELSAYLGWIDTFIFSCPSKIWHTMMNLFKTGNLFIHIKVTLIATILGFLIATISGTVIAIALYSFKSLRKILEPYLVILNSLPKIALGPIIIVWVGTGLPAIILMAVLILIILTILNMLNAFMNVDKDKILLLKSMGATKWQILTKLILPNSLPDFINTLKINVGMSWVGTIMGEYLSSQAGLGYLLVFGSQVFKLDLVMTSIIILCVLASIMYYSVVLLEKILLKKYK